MPYYIASYPRSGNTMVRLILQRHFGISAPSMYNEADPMYASWLGKLLPRLPGEEEVFWKTHGAPPEGEVKGIIVARDGRDAIVSYVHFIRNYANTPIYETPEELLFHLCRGTWRDTLPSWSSFYKQWMKHDVVVLRYEDLCQSEEAAVEIVQEALSRVLQRKVERIPAEPLSFEKLHDIRPNFFRRGESGYWKEEMPPEMEQLFWQTHGAMMTTLGYKR